MSDDDSQPIDVAVCPTCEDRTPHYLDTAECMICNIGEDDNGA